MSTPDLTPRQFGVIADYMAAGNPLAVAALAAGVLPPVAEAAIRQAPWFGEVLGASRALQAMSQPDWLDRVRRMMRGVIERAVAEERVSLLHLAARLTDAMAPEKFDRQDEKRGVDALIHAMANMTHQQLDEWQLLTRRGPAWAKAEAAMRAATPAGGQPADTKDLGGQEPADAKDPGNEPPAGSRDAGGQQPVADANTPVAPPTANTSSPAVETDATDLHRYADVMAPPPPGSAAAPASPFDDVQDSNDEMKSMLRDRCPWPAGGQTPFAAAAGTEIFAGRGFFGSPEPTPEQKADPRMAPAPEIRPPAPARPDPWPWPSDPLAVPQGAMLPPRPPGGYDPRRPIPMPRSVLARMPPGRPVPDWIDQEPPGRWKQHPT